MQSKTTGKSQGKSMIIGLFFLLLGLSILLKILFKIDIPVFRALFSMFLIYLGVRMLTGTFGLSGLFEWKDRSSVVFSEGRFRAGNKGGTHGTEPTQYSVVFGKGNVDLTALTAEQAPHAVEVNVVFGEATIDIDPTSPVHVISNAVFGESRMPDDNQVIFGTLNFRTPTAATASPAEVITVRTNVVFGSIRVRPKAAPRGPVSPPVAGKAKSEADDDDEE